MPAERKGESLYRPALLRALPTRRLDSSRVHFVAAVLVNTQGGWGRREVKINSKRKATVPLGHSKHSVGIRCALDAKRAARRREASGGGGCSVDDDSVPPPPSPSAANARYDFVDSVDSDMDGRWGSNADGSCTYNHERAAAYSAFLCEVTGSSLRLPLL